MRLWRSLQLPRAIKTVERMAPGIQYQDTGRRAPMIKRILRHYKWLPKEGETWAQHAQQLRAELYPTKPEPTIVITNTANPNLTKIDRQLLRRKFKIPKDAPDPKWFDNIEIV